MNKFLFLFLLSSIFLTSCSPRSGLKTPPESEADPNQATMPDQFLQKRVDELKHGQSGWLDTYAISVDMNNKVWITPDSVVSNFEEYESNRKYHAYLKIDRLYDLYVVTIFKSDLHKHKSSYKWKRTDWNMEKFGKWKVGGFSVDDENVTTHPVLPEQL